MSSQCFLFPYKFIVTFLNIDVPSHTTISFSFVCNLDFFLLFLICTRSCTHTQTRTQAHTYSHMHTRSYINGVIKPQANREFSFLKIHFQTQLLNLFLIISWSVFNLLFFSFITRFNPSFLSLHIILLFYCLLCFILLQFLTTNNSDINRKLFSELFLDEAFLL